MTEYSITLGSKTLEFYITEALSPQMLAEGNTVGVCFKSTEDAFFSKARLFKAASFKKGWDTRGQWTVRAFPKAESAFESIEEVTKEWKIFWANVQESESLQKEQMELLISFMKLLVH